MTNFAVAEIDSPHKFNTRDQKNGGTPLSFAQRRLWFLDQLEPGGNEYLIRIALRLTGTLDVPALEEALSRLAERHETLRTRFLADDEVRPYQVIDPPGRVAVEIADLTGRDEETVAARVHEAASAPFDLARGPLLRTVVVHVAPGEAILVICVHHIVFDGWSEIVFARELRALYPAALDGTTAALPAPGAATCSPSRSPPRRSPPYAPSPPARGAACSWRCWPL